MYASFGIIPPLTLHVPRKRSLTLKRLQCAKRDPELIRETLDMLAALLEVNLCSRQGVSRSSEVLGARIIVEYGTMFVGTFVRFEGVAYRVPRLKSLLFVCLHTCEMLGPVG